MAQLFSLGSIERLVKSVLPALLYAALAEWWMYRFASSAYSASVETGLTIVAFVGAIPVGVFARRPLMAFCGGVALGAPVIGYSMIGYGLLEMGGFIHAATFGVWPVIAYELSRKFRYFRVER